MIDSYTAKDENVVETQMQSTLVREKCMYKYTYIDN
jgi:hypothetical protein